MLKRLLTQTFVFTTRLACSLAQDATRKTRVTAGEEYAANAKLHEVLLGRGHRQLWVTPIEVDILDLASHGGGLTPVRRVGGLQTSALALVGADGAEFPAAGP